MSTSREIELKLQLPEEAVEALPRAAPLSRVPANTARLDATYFDTADRLLQKRSMALRLRRAGRQWVQTLKTADSARGGLSSRPEWEAPAKLLRGKPQIDLSLLRDTPLPALLAKHAASGPLQPVFRSRFVRTTWLVSFGKSRIEVAMDRGYIEARRAGKRVAEPIAELELELKEGRAEDLLALAVRLSGRGRRALALVPLVRSKAERGYLISSGAEILPTKAAARGFVNALDREMSAGAALRRIVAHGMYVLLANTEALHRGRDQEYVHQARVALRRMRSALRLFDRKHVDFPAPLADELRWAARLLGSARDWDVLVGQTLPKLVAAEATGEPLFGALIARAEQRRGDAHESVLAALASARYAQLALRLQAWTLKAAPDGRALSQLAPRLLRRAHARLFEAARFFSTLSAERRHRVRIFAKRMRYALDFLSVALPETSTTRYVAALSELQDVLGELNDAAVAQQALREIADSEATLAGASGWFQSREQDLLRTAEERLAALYELPRLWE